MFHAGFQLYCQGHPALLVIIQAFCGALAMASQRALLRSSVPHVRGGAQRAARGSGRRRCGVRRCVLRARVLALALASLLLQVLSKDLDGHSKCSERRRTGF